jgi:hypothetical protein
MILKSFSHPKNPYKSTTYASRDANQFCIGFALILHAFILHWFCIDFALVLHCLKRGGSARRDPHPRR